MNEIILVTCSGLSGTGKLTGQAAVLFMQRYPGLFDRHISADSIDDYFSDVKSECTGVFAVDGCSDCCAKKKLLSCGVESDVHITATDFGIEKRGYDSASFMEIETLVSAIKKSFRQSGLNQD